LAPLAARAAGPAERACRAATPPTAETTAGRRRGAGAEATPTTAAETAAATAARATRPATATATGTPGAPAATGTRRGTLRARRHHARVRPGRQVAGAGPATGRRTLSRTRPLTTGTRPRRRGTRRGTGADAERVVADPRRPRPRLRARLGALGARRDDARRGSRTRLRSRL